MIYYTIKGPTFELEIHENKMHLRKRVYLRVPGTKSQEVVFPYPMIRQFYISASPILGVGKVHIRTGQTDEVSFAFFTSREMMNRIEKYIQKQLLKTHCQKGKDSFNEEDDSGQMVA